LPADWACGRCRARRPAFDRLLSAWTYRPPLDAVLRALKFARLEHLGEHLAEGMAELLAPHLSGFDAVVPVPLHWRRRLARGYNQAALIASPLAARLGIPLLEALRRSRATPPQTALDRAERLGSPRQAFRLRRGTAVAGRRLLLVDDVVTTGATLEAAARELVRGGAGPIVALAAARTPAADET
jgi:ComF family protein